MRTKTHGFPPQNRLTDPPSFDRVFASRERFSAGPVRVSAAANGKSIARLGVAISRRATHTAVVRNRLKRIAREVFRRRQHELAGLDLVVGLTPTRTPFTSLQFTQCLHALFDRLRASSKPPSSPPSTPTDTL